MFTRTNYLRPLALLVWAVLAASVMMVVLASPAHATDFTVNVGPDEQNTNGQCSLREAIINADQNNQSGSTDCAAGSGADTISISSPNATFALSSPLPPITDAAGLTIEGNGATIDGQNQVGVFFVGGPAELALNNLTIANGGLSNGALLTFGGGGIFNSFGATLTLNNSTLAGNSASEFGGGIYNEGGTVTVNNSTLAGNSASGGVGQGGGIANNGGTVTVNNSTLSENSASNLGGGIVNNGGTLEVNNSTLSENSASNGGGIFHPGGLATLRNTIVANSTIPDGTAPQANCSGSPITDGGGNLDDDGTCGFIDSSSLSNTPDGLDPDGLKNNGGPTQTIALQGDSSAIDAAVGCPPPNTDQRGVVRPQDGDANGTAACDIGAFELEEPSNSPPVATEDSETTNEDNSVTINVLANDADPDDDALTVSSVTQPANGSAAINADNTVTYTHNGSETTSDSFTYTISDGKGGTDTAKVTITVTPVNDAPVAIDDPANVVNEGDTVRVEVLTNDTDAEGDTLSAELVSNPAHGTLALNPDGTFSYTHNGSETTSDSFTYKANDGTAFSNVATVTIIVNPVNDAPVAADDTYSTDEDTPLQIGAPGVLENDTDPDNGTLNAVVVEGPANGTLALHPDGSFEYAPNPTFSGTDSFTYRAHDGTAGSNVATVTITVNAANNPPSEPVVSGGACLSDTKASGRLEFTLSDVDGDTLNFSATTTKNTELIPDSNLVTGGSGANRTLTLTAAPKKSGTAEVTVTVSDGTSSSTLVVTVKVGTQNSETINGTGGTDVIFGLAGQNTLNGGGGNDLLCGGNGNDKITGGDDNDVLDGGRGDDDINGGAGNDKLLGNVGADTLTGEGGADSFNGGSGTDLAKDFDAGQGDTRTGIP